MYMHTHMLAINLTLFLIAKSHTQISFEAIVHSDYD